MPKDDSLEREIDKVLSNLEKALDSTAFGPRGIADLPLGQTTAISQGAEKYQLILKCPTYIWQNFIEYCKINELDPAQQVREAVISYYRDLLLTCKIRKNPG